MRNAVLALVLLWGCGTTGYGRQDDYDYERVVDYGTSTSPVPTPPAVQVHRSHDDFDHYTKVWAKFTLELNSHYLDVEFRRIVWDDGSLDQAWVYVKPYRMTFVRRYQQIETVYDNDCEDQQGVPQFVSPQKVRLVGNSVEAQWLEENTEFVTQYRDNWNPMWQDGSWEELKTKNGTNLRISIEDFQRLASSGYVKLRVCGRDWELDAQQRDAIRNILQ